MKLMPGADTSSACNRTSDRQGLRELQALFRRYGFRPSRRRGQSFLVDGNLRQVMVKEAGIDEGCAVLEVGAGTGWLTALLAERRAKVWAVEIDPVLCQIAGKLLGSKTHVELINRDILASKHQLDRTVEERIVSYLDEHPGAHLKVVGNLPYSIATPLIETLVEGQLPVELMAFCVQREVAERLAATGGKSYGAVSVRVQACARVRILRRLPAHVFWPVPKVQSCFVTIKTDVDLKRRISRYPHFAQLVSALFRYRRKRISTIVRLLRADERKELALATGNIPFAGKRPDALAVEEFVSLSNALVKEAKSRPV